MDRLVWWHNVLTIKRWNEISPNLICVSIHFLSSFRRRKNYLDVENISQKINAKLGGINGVVNVKSALSHSSRNDLFMFFGADVNHWKLKIVVQTFCI